MQLTGQQIFEEGIIFGIGEENAIQQQGIDVRLKSVRGFEYGDGYVPCKGKTQIPSTYVKKPDYNYATEIGEYHLLPGYYELEFCEGCKIPNNRVMGFKTRSSLVRCGAIVHSGQFDGGFETENMGAFLHVIKPITIQEGARVAQAIINESYEVSENNMYNGQWQNDKQRNV